MECVGRAHGAKTAREMGLGVEGGGCLVDCRRWREVKTVGGIVDTPEFVWLRRLTIYTSSPSTVFNDRCIHGRSYSRESSL